MHPRLFAFLFLIALLSSLFLVLQVHAQTNLAPIPSAWSIGGSSWSQTLDYTTYHSNSPSIYIGPHNSLNPYREVDAFGYSVNPGDHVIFKMWVKTGHSTLGQDGVFGNGAMINWDWKDASGNWLHDHSTNDPYYDQVGISSIGTSQQQILPFNSGWTQLVLDCIVPAQVYNDGYPSYGSQFEVPKQIALSPSVSWYNPALGGQIDDGPAWYSDAELYINPSGSPTPTPSPTPTMTPTPTPSGSPTPTPTITPTPTYSYSGNGNSGTSGIYYTLAVYVKNGTQVLSNVPVTVGSSAQSTNNYGVATFQLATGTYTASATYNGVTQSQSVTIQPPFSLSSAYAPSITFDFATASTSTSAPSDYTFVVLLAAGGVALVALSRGSSNSSPKRKGKTKR